MGSKSKGRKGRVLSGVPSFNIFNGTPLSPDPPSLKLSKEQLLPPTPSVYLENEEDASSPLLQEFCLRYPIAVIRSPAAAFKLDLGLFSTKTLVEANPSHKIEVRMQVQQASDENWDPHLGRRGWTCFSHNSSTSLAKYARYQASCFQDSLKEERGKVTDNINAPNSTSFSCPVDSNSKDSTRDVHMMKGSGESSQNIPFGSKMLRFGTNVDLSEKNKWQPQLQELMKLPDFVRVFSNNNMLSYVGHDILGMNTVQLYMKVPGSRTPGHQENNNFCSVNINIGPGDCEWFAVAEEYWSVIQKLCEKYGVRYLHGSWWPCLEDLFEENIPVYRFLQRPGDLVWVNAGCVHWVQAVGFCNNIAWNVGPITARQYQLAIERYEWNKIQCYKSIVPMVHLSWNIARKCHVSDPKLVELVKHCLKRTLEYCTLVMTFVKSRGAKVLYYGRCDIEVSHYCCQCEVEVFNILFIMKQKKEYKVLCLGCAFEKTPNFKKCDCIQEYRMSELRDVFDKFPIPQWESWSLFTGRGIEL